MKCFSMLYSDETEKITGGLCKGGKRCCLVIVGEEYEKKLLYRVL